MTLDVADTIAAIAVPIAGAARGIVRVSGPRAIDVAETCFTSLGNEPLANIRRATATPGTLAVTLAARANCPLPCDVYVWPGSASYTRQPTVEFHTLGSPPILEAILRMLCVNGARLAEPGEFTLRAFVAGRLDLTQAEAVLGVIDARGNDALQSALRQLAGGLTQPLTSLRRSLIDLLADLEAGLDFAEEDIEFVSRDELLCRVDSAEREVEALIDRIASRGEAGAVPRVVLVGLPNTGKSCLFNALLARYGTQAAPSALVSDIAGTTRDYLVTMLDINGIAVELIDTAGVEHFARADSIAAAAQSMTAEQRVRSDLRLNCIDATCLACDENKDETNTLRVLTKCDLSPASGAMGVATSAHTGLGLDDLAESIERRIRDIASEAPSEMVASTSARCGESVRAAHAGLTRVRELIEQSAGEELLAAELRDVLSHLGRVVGAVYTDDILDQIFSRFCIGK